MITLERYAALALYWRRERRWFGYMAVRLAVRRVYGVGGLVKLDRILLREG